VEVNEYGEIMGYIETD